MTSLVSFARRTFFFLVKLCKYSTSVPFHVKTISSKKGNHRPLLDLSTSPTSAFDTLTSFSVLFAYLRVSSFGGPMWLFRVFSSALFLAVTVSSIPLAFDVGGKTCGLAFSLSLATFYFLISLLKLSTPDRSWFRSSVITILRATQWVVICVLLIWSLNRFSVETDNTSGWMERTFSGKRAQDSSIQEWLFGRDGLVETVALGNWDRLLRWSTPVFQLAEGFCSLLVIQAAGQITRWLVNRGGRSDSWMVCFDPDLSRHELTYLRLAFWYCPRPSSPAPSTSSGGFCNSPKSPTSMRP